ncbi:MAG: ATP-binding cassette domain-containing protein [Candidatus Hadarchaeum sp.]|uniref:ABC transporter ATP-binding protein n=1 Tax=Candidatus Hadarchaeum sp. TaxID=2883567 RepID=UPI003D12B9EE
MNLAVEVRGLVKIYDHRVVALDGVDLQVEEGKIFALLGPNGAGKTTLMRILTTQIKPTSGEARVFGLDVSRAGAEVRKLISYIPQEMSVWTDISGYENLLIYAKIYGIPPHERKAVIEDALEKMGLREVANDLVKNYSGGMLRRLEIACTILVKPKILFLDEPTIGLDPSARKVVWEELSSIRREYGTTIFFNTHYMDEADLYSDEIAIINQGKIMKQGTAEELRRSVGGEVVQLEIKGEKISGECLDKLRAQSPTNDVTESDSKISLVVEDAERALPDIMEILRAGGVSVEKISVTKPSLDDVFLKYAGTRLESRERISDVKHVRRMIGKG